MRNDEDKPESVPAHTEDDYEAIAGQEQAYLDDVEENLRQILTSEPITTSHAAERIDDQLDHAAEELLTGDSDDPPVAEMLNETSTARRHYQCDV